MKKTLCFYVFFLFGAILVNAQTRQITGTVTSSDDGMGIPGVSIIVKGTTNGTSTDVDGKYKLTIQSDAAILVFSSVGMKLQEIPITSDVINVVMQPDTREIEELIVVGYGTSIKRELTGSITKVETKGLSEIPTSSFESAIQGKTSGVFIEQGSGKLGESVKMRIRGSSSISANNQPLYVVDGVPITTDNLGTDNNQPTSPLADLAMSDVESMQVLKDASAAAIYGSRASNGVVIITTKRGKSGATKFNMNYSVGLSEPSRLMKWLNADQYIELFDEAMDNVSVNGLVWDWLPKADIWQRYGKWNGTKEYDVDWQKEAFQKGKINKLTISASGGNDKTTYYAAINHDDVTGILRGNGMKKLGGRLNLDQKATKRLSFGLQMNLNRTDMDRVENDNAFASPLQLVAQSPLTPVIDPATGELNTNTIYYNGLISLRDSYNNTTVFRSLANVYASYNILDNLTFKSEFGTDILDQREKSFTGRKTITGGPAGEAINRSVRVVNYNWENYFTYLKVFNVHEINLTAGMSFQESNTVGSNIEGKGFPTDDFQNIQSAAEATAFSSWEYGNNYLSYFARANYKLKERYFFSINGRVDGSSRFGVDNRFGFFPAISAGWIISNEPFLEGVEKQLSFLKLRTSYGLTGNSGIPDYAHLALFQGVNYAGRNGIEPTQLQSRTLGWEKTTQFDVGLDFGLFNNRITAEIDYYYKHTTDLLLYKTFPSTSGFTGVWSNFGSLENRGLEVGIRTNNFTGDFVWSTDFNIAFNKNKVLDVDGAEITPNSLNYVIEGQPIGVFKMKKYAGVDPDNGDALYYLNAGSDETTNDYNLAKEQIVGSPNPDFTGGISNTLSYKGFDFNFLINFVYGNMIYRDGGRYQSANANWFDNQTADQMDRWQKPGDITDVPQARLDGANGTNSSSRYLSDGSYLRLRNISFGYTLPTKITKRMKVSSLRAYISILNLYTLTNYQGWDPEVNFTGTGRSTQNSNIIQGQDFYTVPQARTYSIGINLSF